MFPAFALRARALIFPKRAAAGSCVKALLIAIVVAVSQSEDNGNFKWQQLAAPIASSQPVSAW
jgi:acyl dehydratase